MQARISFQLYVLHILHMNTVKNSSLLPLPPPPPTPRGGGGALFSARGTDYPWLRYFVYGIFLLHIEYYYLLILLLSYIYVFDPLRQWACTSTESHVLIK